MLRDPEIRNVPIGTKAFGKETNAAMVKMCRLVLVRLLVINEGAAAFYSSGWIIFPSHYFLQRGVTYFLGIF